MTERSSNKNLKQTARTILEAMAAGEWDESKDPLAVALGRRGGLKGGPARAAKLTPRQRSASAKKAALARWAMRESGE
jgi:hypothetical protein